uniref:Uncharacterized protein n=1 Tax=Romanomermis culicivorax TaxID=13658 RepID=A0A915KKB2_ROMCU
MDPNLKFPNVDGEACRVANNSRHRGLRSPALLILDQDSFKRNIKLTISLLITVTRGEKVTDGPKTGLEPCEMRHNFLCSAERCPKSVVNWVSAINEVWVRPAACKRRFWYQTYIDLKMNRSHSKTLNKRNR